MVVTVRPGVPARVREHTLKRRFEGVPSHMAKAVVVVVEDVPEVRSMLASILEPAGYEVHEAADALEGHRTILEVDPDLVILDISLGSGPSGDVLCRRLRSDPRTRQIGIIALTGLQDEQAWEVAMLDAGVDDYMAKQRFRPDVFLRRCQSVLRRVRRQSHNVREIGPLTIYADEHRVTHRGEALQLTPTEFEILLTLVEADGGAVPRKQLLDRGTGSSVDRTVDVHILSIRRKLGDDEWLIATVWGVGYRLRHAPEA